MNKYNITTGTDYDQQHVPADFISRLEFIRQTGIFITVYQYDHLYNAEFIQSGLSVEKFIETFKDEYVGAIVETEMSGTFTYMVDDFQLSGVCGPCCNNHNLNIMELINNLSIELAESKQEIDHAQEIVGQLMGNNIDIIDKLSGLVNSITEL